MVSQAQVLNKILQTRDFSIIIENNITEDFFYNYPAEFAYIKNHFSQFGTVPDRVTFVSIFPNFEIFDVNEPDEYLLTALTTDYNNATIVTNYNKVKKLMESGRSQEALAQINGVASSVRTTAAIKCTDLALNRHRLELYEDRLNGRTPKYLSTGFPELDALIGGIDPLEENMVIAARTGIGKTWVLIKMAVALFLQGKNVGFYSGEMTADKVGYRFDTLLAESISSDRRFGVNLVLRNNDLIRGNTDGSVHILYNKYFEFLDKNKDKFGSVKVITPADIAGPATVDALKAFVEREKIEVLLVDQYSLLEDTSNSKALFERVGNISKAIKLLQVTKHIPIIAVSQFNRNGEKDKDGNIIQDTTQIGLADRIGQDATVIIGLNKRNKKEEDGVNEYTELKIKVLKARDGGDDKELSYRVNLNIGKFTFIADKNSMSSEEVKDLRDEFEVDEDISAEGDVFGETFEG